VLRKRDDGFAFIIRYDQVDVRCNKINSFCLSSKYYYGEEREKKLIQSKQSLPINDNHLAIVAIMISVFSSLATDALLCFFLKYNR
jgi:hypothetical protein